MSGHQGKRLCSVAEMARDREPAPAVKPARGAQRPLTKISKRAHDLPGSLFDRGNDRPAG
jgi:hypothetical protein